MNLLDKLQHLISEILVSQEIIFEFSQTWQQTLPEWLIITSSSQIHLTANPPTSLSEADLSTIYLALEYSLPLASDDYNLRNFAKELGIKVTGSLGLLKTLYRRKIILTKQSYVAYLDALKQDVFISDELYKWALDI